MMQFRRKRCLDAQTAQMATLAAECCALQELNEEAARTADLKAGLVDTQAKLTALSETRLGDLEAERQKAAALAKILEADVVKAEQTVQSVKQETEQTSIKMSLDA